MACVSSMPYSDLTYSQYLWPSAVVELRMLAANASARAEYKAQLQRQYESSLVFQRQFAIFVAQLVHQQQRAGNLANGPLFDVSGFASPSVPVLSPHSPVTPPTPVTPWPSCTSPQDKSMKSRRRQKSVLVAPLPRVSSCLSPAPPRTPLPGPPRRPMPPYRAREAPEMLLKKAVLNYAHGRASTAENVRVDVMEVDEEQGQSWVVVPGEDWEMVDSQSSL